MKQDSPLVWVAVLALALGAGSAAAQPAPSSCKGFQDMCAARCKERAPQDRNCVSDHCTPKLQECRVTGCWQEGARYGGARTCNLRKS
jgi:hypothetical protein